MRMAWLKGPDGSTGSLTPRLLKIRSEGFASPSGWTGKQAGRPQSVALQRRSGGVALPAWTGSPAGTVGPPVRVAQPGSKARPGRWGHWDSHFPSAGRSPERRASDSVTGEMAKMVNHVLSSLLRVGLGAFAKIFCQKGKWQQFLRRREDEETTPMFA